MPFVNAGDANLYYEVHGSGEPLLLVSGQGSDHHGWDAVREDFASRYMVIVFDHRGTGQSDKPREPAYSTRGFARDAVTLLDHLGIDRFHAYGVSMGGRICQWLGLDYPERAHSLVLGCTTPGNAHGVRRPPEVDAVMANRPTDPNEAMQFLMEQMVSPEYIKAHPEFVEAYRQRILNPIPPYAQKLHYLASEGHDTWELLPQLKAPVFIIHGDQDTVNVTANAYLLHERIPHSELHIVRGARHGYFLEFRVEASGVVLDFLARHSMEA